MNSCWLCAMMFKLFQLIMYVCFFLVLFSSIERLPDVGIKLLEAYKIIRGRNETVPSSDL
jgi:hypothetical protein